MVATQVCLLLEKMSSGAVTEDSYQCLCSCWLESLVILVTVGIPNDLFIKDIIKQESV